MNKVKLIETGFDGLFVIETMRIGDSRGFFSETYNYRDFKSLGVDIQFVQDNQSRSAYGVTCVDSTFKTLLMCKTKMMHVCCQVQFSTWQ